MFVCLLTSVASSLLAAPTSGVDALLANSVPAASSSAGGDYPNLHRKFSLSAGASVLRSFHTSMQVSSESAPAPGAVLDMEELLGLDDSDLVGRLDGHYSFNPRHRIDFTYYDIERDGERSITDDIQVGQVVIPAGSVETEFDTEIIKLAYRYNFVTDPRTVIGASFGIHLMRLRTSVQSNIAAVSETFEVDAPLPLFGLHGAYALSDKWTLSASAELLQFDVGSYGGFISNNRLTLEHDTFEHFGWGVGFDGFRVDANADGDDNLSGEIDYGYQGLFLYLRMFF